MENNKYKETALICAELKNVLYKDYCYYNHCMVCWKEWLTLAVKDSRSARKPKHRALSRLMKQWAKKYDDNTLSEIYAGILRIMKRFLELLPEARDLIYG